MKNIISVFIIALLTFNSYAVEEKKPEVKKVCVDEKQKDGKTRQVCKEIKVHKKLEGTPVPGQKK
jgi:hypothetical protein